MTLRTGHRSVATAEALLTPRFDGRNFGQIRWQLGSGKGLDIHLDQADKWAAKVWFRLAASIENYADCGNGPTAAADNVDRFLHASAARHDIFDHDEFFIWRNLKAAAQDKFALVFFDKNMSLAQRPSDFLANDNSAQSRGDDCVAIKFAQLIREPSTNFCGDLSVLKEQGALEILLAVQAGAQNEVAIEQRASFAKKCKKIFAPQIPNSRANISLHRHLILAGGVICRLPGLLRDGNNFDFHVGSFRQRGDLDGGTGRGILLEIRPIDFVNHLEITEVGKEDGCLDDIVESQTLGSQNGCDVIEDAPCLCG